MNDIDRILALLLKDLQDIQSYKIKFVEKKGCCVCGAFLSKGQGKLAIEFVSGYLPSKEEITNFYKMFFQSQNFRKFFTPEYLKKISDAIASFINKSISQSEFNINKIIINALVLNFSQCFKIFYYGYGTDIQILFKAMDKFLLSTTHDDQKALKELKQEIFMDKNGKLYISIPLDFLNQLMKNKGEQRKNYEIEELWHRMVGDFFNWICSSEENLKSEILEKFWNSKEILEAKKQLHKTMNNIAVLGSIKDTPSQLHIRLV